MNAQPQAQLPPKDETKKDSADFKNKLAKFINPFYVSFVIFWVVCNYDFLLILIGKKAILQDLYSHFGYGCNKKSINLFVCVEKSRLAYAGYFAIWKVIIPLGLTLFHTHFVYNIIIKPVNEKDRSNKESEKGSEEWRKLENQKKEIENRAKSLQTMHEDFIKEFPQKVADAVKRETAFLRK